MSAETIERIDLDGLFEHLMENMDDEDFACQESEDPHGLVPCPRPAEWTATTMPCGHSAKVCSYHRMKTLGQMAAGVKMVCAVSKAEILDIIFEPLG